MKLIGILTRKENIWVIQIPRPVLKVAELNGVKISSKVRTKIRIYKDGEQVDVDAKVQVYGKEPVNLKVTPKRINQGSFLIYRRKKRGEL
jgi:hypothetical protein